MPDDTLSIELVINDSGADVVLARSKQKLGDFVKDVETKSPNIKFKIDDKSFIDLDRLKKNAEQTRAAFAQIASTRLNSNNIGFLTKDIVLAHERARQLETDIISIKNELSNPNRKSSIAFLIDELRGAEREADSLNRKLSTLPTQQTSPNSTAKTGGGGSVGSGGRPIPYLRGYGAVLRGVGSPVGEMEINAATQIAGIAGIGAATLAAFGAIAAAGYGIVKITQNIREEAERRLKVEERIQGAINRQIIAGQEGLKTLQKIRQEDERRRQFDFTLSYLDIDALKRQRDTAQKLYDLAPKKDLADKGNAELQLQQVRALDAKIIALQKAKEEAFTNNFFQQGENYAKNQRNAAEFQFKQQKAINEEIEKSNAKIKEFGKTIENTFDGLSVRLAANNPIAAAMLEGEKAVRNLKETLATLPPQLQAIGQQAILMQQKLNANNLFSAKLDSGLEAFDLRERAKSLRSYQPPTAEIKDTDKFFKEFIEAGLKKIPASNGGSYTQYNRTADGGFSQSDARNDLLKVYEREGTFGTFFSRDKTFADLTGREKQDFFDSTQKQEFNQSVNDRLQKQLGIVQSGAFSDDQRAIADRKLIALSSGINPAEISGNLREKLALANEREATRKEAAEKDAKRNRDESLEVQQNILKALNALTKNGNPAAAKTVIEIMDKSNGKARVLGASPTPRDVADNYHPDLNFAGGGTLSNY